MTNYSPSQSEPDDFPLELGDVETAPWDQADEDVQVFEGAWSDYTAEVAEVLRPGFRYQVKYEATYWTAIPEEPGANFQAGELVVVLARKGNELIIKPLPRPAEE